MTSLPPIPDSTPSPDSLPVGPYEVPSLDVERWSMSRRIAFLFQNLRSAAPLWIVDAGSLSLCMFFTWLALRYFYIGPHLFNSLSVMTVQVGIVTFAFTLLRLYPGVGLHPVVELRQSAYGIILGFGCSLVGMSLTDKVNVNHYWLLLLSAPVALVTVPTARQYARQFLAKTHWWCQPVVILAAPEVARNLWHHLSRQPQLGWKPTSVIDLQSDSVSPFALVEENHHALPHPRQDLNRIANSKQIFCAILDDETGRTPDLIQQLHVLFPRLVTIVNQSETAALWVEGIECAGLPCICYHSSLEHPFQRLFKRIFDIFVSGSLLLSLAPIFLSAAIALKLTTKGSIFFSHYRTGRFGEQFRIWKFRSMVENSEEILEKYLHEHPELDEQWKTNIKLDNDPRITFVGRILRKTSIDELPQLWNVFMGSMSLIGPRPILNEEVAKYGSTYQLYAQVRPGMTGLWQVSGRNKTSYEERLHYVSYYVRNWSLWLDWYIMLKTFRVVVSADGAT